MLVSASYFPHLRAAEETRLRQELERRRVADERAPVAVRARWWTALARLTADPGRRVEECCEALEEAASPRAEGTVA